MPDGAVRLATRLAQGQEARGAEQLGLLVFLDDTELRTNIRLEGEEMQQAFAEGMDGLDLQAARRLHRAREKAPGKGQVDLCLWMASIEDLLAQVLVICGRPCGEGLEDTHGHVGCRRLRIGQAEDLGGRHALQQQADDALCEHMGLARTRIGGHPRGQARIGSALLRIGRVGRDLPGQCHVRPLPPWKTIPSRGRDGHSARSG